MLAVRELIDDREPPEVYPGPRFWIVNEAGRVVAAALWTPPHNLLLAQVDEPRWLTALAADVLATLPLPGVPVSDLTAKEQKAVRTALRFLRLRLGAWAPLAKALRYEWDSIQKVATGKRAVTPALALRVARPRACRWTSCSRASGSRRAPVRTAGTRRRTSWTRTR